MVPPGSLMLVATRKRLADVTSRSVICRTRPLGSVAVAVVLVLVLVVRECRSEAGPVFEAFQVQGQLLQVWQVRIQ